MNTDFELYYEKDFTDIQQDKNGTYYSRKEENDESSQMNIYHVMDGLEFTYNHFCSKSAVDVSYTQKAMNVIELNHCRQGRFGCQVKDQYIYLGQGEIEVNILGIERINPEFPLGYYEGLSFIIDVDVFVQSIHSVFPVIAQSITKLKEQVELGIGASLIHPDLQLNTIFNEIYEIDPSRDLELLKIKIFEVLMLLETMPYERRKEKAYYKRSDLETIKELRAYAIKRLDIRIPFEDLCKQFHFSSTMGKQAFKEVYGMPYYTYMKQYRIHKALHYLQESSLSIRDISTLLGYENASKFSKAFKTIIGLSPTQYRRNKSNIQHLDILDVEIDDE